VAERTAESWVRRSAAFPQLRFTAKAHRSITHEPAEDGDVGSDTLRGLRPLLDAGRLGAVLLQFPQSFRRSAATLARLARILDAAAGWPLVVEVRHASWDDDAAADWLAQAGVGWCVVDQPQVDRSTAKPTPRVSSRIGYLRLHGRNAADWFREGAGRDARYDYLYSTTELRLLADLAGELARRTEETFVVQNNHFRGKAVVNALQLKHLLTGATPAAPESLVLAHPELAPIVSVVDRDPKLF
jgi:uncharacterized protein YecE (DUF72 family)